MALLGCGLLGTAAAGAAAFLMLVMVTTAAAFTLFMLVVMAAAATPAAAGIHNDRGEGFSDFGIGEADLLQRKPQSSSAATPKPSSV